jgi:hypothetical protein
MDKEEAMAPLPSSRSSPWSRSGPASSLSPATIDVYAGDPCGARQLQPFVARRQATWFNTPAPIRILQSGEAATTDFSAERLNVRIDASGQVAAVDCGQEGRVFSHWQSAGGRIDAVRR